MTLGLLHAAGGTGGHLYPMLAIDDALRARTPIDSVWICSQRAIDATILRAAGREPTPIPARPVSRRPADLASLVWNWGRAVRQTRDAIRALRARTDRVVMLTTGGFVSAPAAQAARAERVPIGLLALDAVPGKASRLVARRARIRLSVYDLPGYRQIGPVIRAQARATADPAQARARFGLDPARPTLVVTGGSQGAQSLTRLVLPLVESRADLFQPPAGWQLLHQVRDEDAPEARALYERLGVRAHVAPLLAPMGDAWAAADLALCRAGAGTVAELWAARLPSVLLPFPHHADQHQARNAAPLVDAGGAILEADRLDARANLAHAGAAVLALMERSENRAAMRAALGSLPPPEGVERAADALLALAGPP